MPDAHCAIIGFYHTNKKLVTIACYDKQHVCAYLQPFSHYTR